MRDGGARELERTGLRGIIASLDALAGGPPDEIQVVRSLNERAPLFVFPDDARNGISPDAARALSALGDVEIAPAPALGAREFSFSSDPLLWPFRGLRLIERSDRPAASVPHRDRGIDPLISSPQGPVFFGLRGGRGRVFVATTSPLEAAAAIRLRDEFRPERFAGLLPLMLFARAALGEMAWRAPRPRANFMIDDPNLRSKRYGCVDYGSLVRTAGDRGMHFTIAMSPIDYRKTRPPVARFMRENQRCISLVPHGVEHLKKEFAREVTLDSAVAVLLDGMRRLELHREATGIEFPRAMTFPHGACNPTWLEAMRRTGFAAAFAARSLAFTPEEEIDWPLYEMYPAEMSFRGFPIVNRFAAEKPRERLLFAAWLDKPLVIYTHHQYFRDGTGGAEELADFLARQVGPTWGGIRLVINENYQSRRSRDRDEVRSFANALEFEAGSAPSAADGYRTPLRAGVRRLATEARDRSAAVLA